MSHFAIAYSAGIPLIGSGPILTVGNVWFVDSGHEGRADAQGNGTKPDTPFATLAFACSQCTANNNDIILITTGHTETIVTATALALDIAGITVIGMGHGDDRPKFTVQSLATATITVSAASVGWYNCIIIGNLDGLNTLITVTGTDFHCDLETWDTSSTVESAIGFTVSGDRCRIRARHRGFSAGDQMDDYITLTGVDNARIDLDFFGDVNTAVVDMLTTCTDVEVRGTVYTSQTNGARDVVDTAGTSTWFAEVYDASAGAKYSGGSAATWAKDDLSVVASDLVVTQSDIKTVLSNLVVAKSDIVTIQSDLTVAKSDIVATLSNVVACKSDLVVLQVSQDSDMVVLKSDIVSCQSNLAAVKSDLVVIQASEDSDMVVLKSDIVVCQSNIAACKSDLVVLQASQDSDMVVLKSDIVVIQSNLTVAKSDIVTILSNLTAFKAKYTSDVP